MSNTKNAFHEKDLVQILADINQNNIVAMQSAWIEWQRGQGAEKAMAWIHNTLLGPGMIPDEDEPWADNAQLYFNANCADPLPTCFCGKPSNHGAFGKGFCSDEHYKQYRMVISPEYQNYLRTGKYYD